MEPERTFWHWVRFLPVLAVAWLAIAGLLLLEFWPSIPQSKSQWALFLAFGPPFYLLGEAVSERVFSRRRGSGIAPAGFSLKRVLVGVPIALAVIALLVGAVWLLIKP